MGDHVFPSLRSAARLAILGLLVAAQGFAGMPRGGPYERGFHPGFRGGFRGPFYGRGRWHGGWGPGFLFPVLPLGCVTLWYGGAAWYYGDGFWFRPWDQGYMADYPPAGIVVPALPPDCATFSDGGVSYYSANGVYYTAAAGRPGYAVVAPPPGRPVPQPPPGSVDAAALDALVVVPQKGQNEATILADRREAQRFASNRTGYDPAFADPSDPGTPRARQAFLKSMKTYLEGRGYSVR